MGIVRYFQNLEMEKSSCNIFYEENNWNIRNKTFTITLKYSSRINEVDLNPKTSLLPLIQQPRQKLWAACGGAAQLLPEAR